MRKLIFLPFLAAGMLMVSCNDNDDDSEPIVGDNGSLISRAVEAIGTEASIRGVQNLSISATGKAFEFQEEDEPVNGLVADFTYDLNTTNLATSFKQSWDVDTDFAFESAFEFVETVNGTRGKSVGNTGFFSVEFASFGATGDPMYSTKIAARRKSIVMSSPILLLQYALENPEEQAANGNVISVNYNTSSQGFGSATPDIQLEINTETGLPIRAMTLENDPLFGDVVYEVVYSEWETVKGFEYPNRLTHIINGNVIREVTFDKIDFNVSLDTNEFTVTDSEAFEYSETEAMAGYLSSQFHFRTLLLSFPADFPTILVEATAGTPTALLDFDNKVLRVAGDLQSHYTYVFDLGEEIVVYDTPLNDRRTTAVLRRVEAEFPGKRISNVIISHDHFDHSGGVRGMLASGGDLVVGSASKSFYETILSRPSTVIPNPLANKTLPNVIGVNKEISFGTGDDVVRFFTINSDHTVDETFLLGYRPVSKTLFINDLHNPGFNLILDTTNAFNKERLVRLAKQLVDFIEIQNLDVLRVVGTHGFVDENSVAIQTLIDLANSN